MVKIRNHFGEISKSQNFKNPKWQKRQNVKKQPHIQQFLLRISLEIVSCVAFLTLCCFWHLVAFDILSLLTFQIYADFSHFGLLPFQIFDILAWDMVKPNPIRHAYLKYVCTYKFENFSELNTTFLTVIKRLSKKGELLC